MELQYLELETSDGHKYFLNENQNIAYEKQDGTIDFTLAKKLHAGQKLASMKQQLTVVSVKKSQVIDGVYAPYIEHGSLYILSNKH